LIGWLRATDMAPGNGIQPGGWERAAPWDSLVAPVREAPLHVLQPGGPPLACLLSRRPGDARLTGRCGLE
jgi:hypothetical protein